MIIAVFWLSEPIELVEAQEGIPPSVTTSATGTVYVWARTAAAVATVVAVGLGGIFAWRRGIIFRHEQPHVTITHEITHRRISPEYVHLEIAVTLHNTSRVKTEFRDGLFSVEQLAPLTDEHVEKSFAKAFVYAEKYESPEWFLLKESRLEWGQDVLVVEPGEKAVETYEYIVPDYIESVIVSTHYCNVRVFGKIPVGTDPRYAERKSKLGFWQASGVTGWTKTTAHDIVISS